MPNNPDKNVVAYVPVIHRGYIELFENHADATINILDEDVIDEIDYLRKDIRALKPAQAKEAIEGMYDGLWDVQLLGRTALIGFESEQTVMPQEDVSEYIAATYLDGLTVEFEPVFLRWDRERSLVNQNVKPDSYVAANELESYVTEAFAEAEKSDDWWRQVGAVTFKDGEMTFKAHNHHLPTEFSNQIDGDPRNTARRGESVDASTAIHAEAEVIAQAAKRGESLDGSSILVTTFPCPSCAKLIALSGMKSCYYIEGYAMTDGLKVLRDHNVEVIKVEDPPHKKKSKAYKPYPKRKRN